MNSKVYKWCSVPQCTNTSIKTPNKLFIFVPHKKTTRDKWLKLARRDLTRILPNTQLYFCEDHFDLPNDMENYMQYHLMGSVSQIRMKPGCAPTKFYCQPDKRKHTSDTTDQKYIYKKQRKILIGECKKEIEGKNNNTKQLELGETSLGNSEMPTTTTTSIFISPNLCRCCHSFGFYTDMSTDAPEGKETYENILNETFNIQIPPINKGSVKSSTQICDECINKLQEAYAFRNMVIANESKMLEHFDTEQSEKINIKEFEHTIIKSEIDVKEEYINEGYMENEIFDVETNEDINIKEDPEHDIEDVIESQSKEIASNKIQDKLQNNEEDYWPKVLGRRGERPILRENSLKLLENSTMFPFQYNKCRYLCLICKKQFIEMATLRNHNLTHSAENLEKIIIRQNQTMVKVEISILICKKCDANFENLDDLRVHLTEKHSIKFPIKENLLIPYKIENEGLKCQICSELFDNFRILSMHVNKHYKNHICDVCGHSYSNLVFLNLHKTRAHKKHVCTECNMNFETGTDKKKHDIDKHDVKIEKKLRFVCWYCNERFSQENLKMQHLVDKHGIRKPDYKCPFCSKGFITKSLCNNHMKNVHMKEKKHECDICNNFFYTKSDLMRHRVTHTGEKKFSCALCSTLFATKDSLRRHVKRSHN